MSLAMWKLEKDLCRCCHAEGSFKHLSDPCFQLGQEEIYSDMLQDCLDIKIVPMTGALSDVTYTICESCISRLRDAANFKRQVQDCEERFKDMYSKNLIKGFALKDEPEFEEADGEIHMKQEFQSMDDDDDDGFMKFDDEADDSLEESNLITIEVEAEPKSKGKGKAKPKEKAKKPTVKKTTGKLKTKPVKVETEELTEAAVSGEKKKGNRRGVISNSEYAKFCQVSIDKYFKKTYNCTLCVSQYSMRKRWTEHYKSFHLKLRKKTHPCVICKEELLPRLRWKHMEEKHDWPAPTCNDCGRKFSYPFQVAKHQKEYHLGIKEQKFICDQCGKKFALKFHLKQHCALHLEARDFTCDQCPKSFKTLAILKKHMTTHSDVKTHYCDQCGKGFLNAKYLNAHASRHIQEKNVKCEICSKRYKTTKLMKRHMKIHLNDKRHVCPLCDMAYVQSNNLKYHMRTKHPGSILGP